MRNRQADAAVDVFYIHPTTYFSRAGWNQPLDDEDANRGTEFALRAQASAFNEVGRIYAPRYRQMTLNGYLSDSDADRDKALDLAYRDVRAAFDEFIGQRSHGRPFIIAAHSQGSGHGLRLLSELMSDLAPDPALRKRLVAAYLIGAAVPQDALQQTVPGIALCATPQQTGCAVFYNTIESGAFDPGERPKRFERVRAWYPGGFRSVERPRLLCVKPGDLARRPRTQPLVRAPGRAARRTQPSAARAAAAAGQRALRRRRPAADHAARRRMAAVVVRRRPARQRLSAVLHGHPRQRGAAGGGVDPRPRRRAGRAGAAEDQEQAGAHALSAHRSGAQRRR